ncbi:MBL fold metallo-hydrolase [Rhodoferax sp.]|uniref:MBL fold metallo-hydrolase n=1 Tax=Rhodoferax sp. TaxID=50421 RepID=UPI0028469F43|nr:MBL fold metallo-hydrolase [Rhodoferax sp.]MDR3372064.1 MBL fold metallo-hydrolase [Rhodoferax sp.]
MTHSGIDPVLSLALPTGVTVLERGWLSSNNILIQGLTGTALIDSGYCTHAPQTLALVQADLQGRPLDLLANTHLHSDHCGGNAALQAAYPLLRTLIPPGQAQQVRAWDPYALSYTPTGQDCPRFKFDEVLQPGTDLRLGDALWQVHAAPGHDPHSVILFEPISRCLISADALWQRGFGVVFPELDGAQAFDEVAATLDVIEELNPRTVIPGHGAPFVDVSLALTVARQRLTDFVASPRKHIQYAAKVMLKFKLLQAQSMTRDALLAWAHGTPYLAHLFERLFANRPFAQGLDVLVQELVRSGAARWQGSRLHNV